MRFLIKQTGSGSERIGNLTGFLRSPGAEIETPTAALFTQGGSVVHLTAEVLSQVFSKTKLLWLPLSNSIHLETGVKAQNDGVAKFAGLSGHVTCTTLHSLSEVTPSGHFELDRAPLWTKNGKKMVSADRYMDVMEIFKPDICLAIADGRTSLNEGSKRISKAVDRSYSMLKTCINRYKASKELQSSSLVGVVVGTGNPKRCDDSIQNILKHVDDLTGIALQGILDGTEESMDVDIEKLNEILEKVGKVCPKELVHIFEGHWNPSIIMSAVEHGWDVFDGSYPVKLTNAGVALKLNFNVTKDVDTMYLLDMVDERYKEDFTPILEGCECLACRKHTRAYIRHLLNTREMLASVLLAIHNLHHFDQMFYHTRQHIAANTFAVFKQHITKQCEMLKNFPPNRHKASNGPNKQTENPNAQQKKKKCVSEVDKSHINSNGI
ncbi:queuine tRNA-ribosyltransferase accessory subunit 2 [Maniola hyperantus]|uniref:queuine tRNA-ribosyltransferase accessory subunit 2 n=1 Tax=Aphantopus hyperantus TaxID=2795564 RepID=UPI0015697342|nr:queuine tRNA-ribosyltransferase accessory subunit 2 [Maniola hyperantus]